MRISSAIAQFRTMDLAGSIHFYTTKIGLTLEFQYQDFYAGTREFVIKDDQGHTLYFGENL